MPPPRLNFHDSILRLRQLGYVSPDDHPVLPDRMPQPEDNSTGLVFFRTVFPDAKDHSDLDNISLPRTFFGRSLLANASFRNTDFSESNFRWNDIENIDFTDAKLTGADFRCSLCKNLNFSRADLQFADLRNTNLKACTFTDANMHGALLTYLQRLTLPLSPSQKASINWKLTSGPTPTGG